MPKSKRNKQVELSKTKKHGLIGKKHLYDEIRSCVDSYAQLYVFSVTDMRNTKMKTVRELWKHSRFFIGKNKVMAMALGRTPEEEYRTNLFKISQQLKGERGLLFSNKSTEEVLNWFNAYTEGDYARSGYIASENVSLKEGPLTQFVHSLESYLRQLGLPTTLKKGVVHLLQDYEVCKVGDKLTPDTAKILRLLGYEMAEFQVKIECVWSQDGTFLDLKSDSKENIVKGGSKSAIKEGFQVSEDLTTPQDEDMETMECDTKDQEKTHSNSSDEELSGDDDNKEESAGEDENKTEIQDKQSQDEEDIEETKEQTKGSIEDTQEDEQEEGTQQDEQEEGTQQDEQEEGTQQDDNESNENKQGEEITETDLVKLTKEKIKEVESTPPKKYSPKLTRSRARASAVKKVLSPEERAARKLRSARKAPKK